MTQTVGDTSSTLDAASTTWFTAVCNGLAPTKTEAAKMGTVGGTTEAEKLTALSPVLAAIGKLYSTTAATASALPPPGIPGGSDYATKAIAAFSELGELFQAGADSAATGDNSKVATLTADANTGPAAVAMATLTMTPETKAAITSKIPTCVGIIN